MSDTRCASTSLRQALPDVRVLTDPADTEAFRFDETELPARGPAAAVSLPALDGGRPGDRALGGDTGTPLVPRGAGTGLSGGAVAIDGA